jgi:polysaccharide lyase-like protein
MNVGNSRHSMLLLLRLGALGCGLLACSDSMETPAQTPALNTAGSGGTASAPPDAVDDDTAVCQTALYCDGFEASAPDLPPGAPWTVTQNNGTVQVATARAFRGTHAVKATTFSTAMTGQTYKSALIGMAQAPVVPLPDERVYGRMMFYLESAPTESVHWTFIDGTGLVPGQVYSATYRYGGQKPVTDAAGVMGNQLMANYDTTNFYNTPPVGPQTDCYQHADQQLVPVGAWACAEWSFDGPQAQMRFWLNGSEITSLAVNRTGQGCVAPDQQQTWVAPTFSRLDVGWESYQTDDERTIWIDDVVFSRTQVGCPKPR